MPTVAPTDRSRVSRSRPARPVRSAPPRSDRRGRPSADADRRRVQEICVAVFLVALLTSVVATLVLRDAPGLVAVVPALLAAYVAGSAWLGAVIATMRRPSHPAATFWAVTGAVALILCFALQVVVEVGQINRACG